jgi:hypothetical protein
VLCVPVSFLPPKFRPDRAVPSGFAVVGFDREQWIQEGEKLGEREATGGTAAMHTATASLSSKPAAGLGQRMELAVKPAESLGGGECQRALTL